MQKEGGAIGKEEEEIQEGPRHILFAPLVLLFPSLRPTDPRTGRYNKCLHSFI